MAHASQYFSTIVTFSPTSKHASCVARFAQVTQYFTFRALIVTKGVRVSNTFAISREFFLVSIREAFGDSAESDGEGSTNLVLLSLFSVIKPREPLAHKNVVILLQHIKKKKNEKVVRLITGYFLSDFRIRWAEHRPSMGQGIVCCSRYL